MDWMMWAMILQQQAQQAEARRQQEEAAARAKAEADAQAAAEAQAQRQAQIAQQRQTEAAAAKADEDARLAAVNGRAAPIAPADSYSPVGGSFYGSGVANSTAQNVGAQQGMQAFAQNKPAQQPSIGSLGDMFGKAYSGGGDAAKSSSSNVGGAGGGAKAGYTIF